MDWFNNNEVNGLIINHTNALSDLATILIILAVLIVLIFVHGVCKLRSSIRKVAVREVIIRKLKKKVVVHSTILQLIAMAGLSSERAFLYKDDLIVFGASLKEHDTDLRSVLDGCRKYNLKLNPKKCRFLLKTVAYLGHEITAQGIRPDPDEYSTIQKYPLPKSADDARRFITSNLTYQAGLDQAKPSQIEQADRR